MTFLEHFKAVLFDLNGTLADDYDRFGDEQDYLISYRRHGGRRLDRAQVTASVDACLTRLLARYESPPADPFPPVREFLATDGLPEAEIRALESTIAEHEMGHVPASRIGFLRGLAATHRLGLVSDLWAPADQYRVYLQTTSVAPLFGSLVFSCEHGAVKPSPRLFRAALAEIGVAPDAAVFVGDSPSRDIAGAAACGMATILVGTGQSPGSASSADRVVNTVEEIVRLD